jgi:hypothetical protein
MITLTAEWKIADLKSVMTVRSNRPEGCFSWRPDSSNDLDEGEASSDIVLLRESSLR